MLFSIIDIFSRLSSFCLHTFCINLVKICIYAVVFRLLKYILCVSDGKYELFGLEKTSAQLFIINFIFLFICDVHRV